MAVWHVKKTQCGDMYCKAHLLRYRKTPNERPLPTTHTPQWVFFERFWLYLSQKWSGFYSVKSCWKVKMSSLRLSRSQTPMGVYWCFTVFVAWVIKYHLPVSPFLPGVPVAPVSPLYPVGPGAPLNPGGPRGPAGPVHPCWPGAPGNPCGPVEPVGPKKWRGRWCRWTSL